MNKILDYKQVTSILQKLSYNTYIYTHKPIGYSAFGFPISHYSIGNGKNHIVITGATHGSEIITTDFILRLMDYISKINVKDVTIHFIPILNPEGYIVSTSAVRELIPRDMPDNDAQHIIKEYVKNYNSDGYDYQQMFSDIDYSCIPLEYDSLRDNIKKLCHVYNIPKGTLQVWSSNGNGIDLNQNCPYNQKLNNIKNNIDLYGHSKYGNIVVTNPGPIGCPSKSAQFEYEPETKCFREFVLNLKHDKNINLCAYINYHSAEDTIFYKPISSNEICTSEKITDISKLTIYNEKIAKLYSSNTSHNLFNETSKTYCFNDMLRLEIPGDILVELSPNEGNPLSAYDDRVYKKTIINNLSAAMQVIEQIPELYKQYNTKF